MIKTLLFDLDNTLYSYEPCNQAGIRVARHYLCTQLSISHKQFDHQYAQARTLVHRTLAGQAASHSRLLYIKTLCEQLRPGEVNSALWERGTQLFWQAYLHTMQLRPGIKSLLRQAHGTGYNIAIVTDLTTEVQLRKLRKFKLESYIDALVTSEDVGKEKPHPAMIKRALYLLNETSKTALIIGDSQRDQIVAKRCHIPFYRLARDAAVPGLTRRLGLN